MQLCLDFGNTNVKYAVYDERQLVAEGRQSDCLVRDIRAWRRQYAFDKVILSSTRNLRASLLRHLDREYQFVHLSHRTPLPIANAYHTPETLGRDRLAAAIGAWVDLPTAAHLVIDIGTCITYDIVAESTFMGGNIAPGVHLRIKAMNDYTDKLPLVEKHNTGHLLGRSTTEALQNGAVLGTLCEIEAFIARSKARFPSINVTLTGGDAEYFAQLLDSKIFVAPLLVLKGLNEILLYNA